MSNRPTLAKMICIVLFGTSAVLLWRFLGTDGRAPADSAKAWPERIGMTCQSCGTEFEMPTSDYLAAMEAVRKGSAGAACPGCGKTDSTRREHGEDPRARMREAGG